MGYAIFTARKMNLQAKVSDYNAQLMRIEQKKLQVTEQITAKQAETNKIDNAQNVAKGLFNFVGMIGGAYVGGATGAQIGGSLANATGGAINSAIDMVQDATQNAELDRLSKLDKELDRQKQRIDTLLKQASTDLQKVEDAESKAIERSTAKYIV